MSLRIRWDARAVHRIVDAWPRESAKGLRDGFARIGQNYRRAMFDRFKAPISGPPFYANTSRDLLKTRSGGLRATVGFANARAAQPKDLRLVLFVGDGATKHYDRIQEYGGVVTPKRSRFLTLPLPDNLTAAGVPRFPSARALFAQHPGRVWVERTASGFAVIKYRPEQPLYGKEILTLWGLKASVRLRPRLGFRATIEAERPARLKELRAALARTLQGVRAAAKGGAA